ncbi:hypothetical protein PVAG01_01691 [Phlyctema vagabunda]|uniref:Ubiquitin-like modifier HUB1 n=1 Tax=Phlyctema vagabunda TaxID=108571 RepID=A0ABR4PYG9_9HELO
MGDSRRSRSPPPQRERERERDRDSRDRRDRPRNNQRSGGFKWKENRRDGDGEQDGGEKRLARGYRNRSRSPRRDREKGRKDNSNDKSKVEDKFGVADKFGSSAASTSASSSKKEDSSKPPQRAPAAQQPVGEPLIVVHINDRLGTKAAIPCLASDPIRLFKAQVAAQIGRQPHEILLKRQGERPFKDQLTLEDYGVSNGVQLDLEIDTQ